jgi:hypothetical protein
MQIFLEDTQNIAGEILVEKMVYLFLVIAFIMQMKEILMLKMK